MKALSLKQPWASLVACGKKTIETRTWKTNYRGKLLIVSSKKFDEKFPFKNFSEVFFKIPFGMALAIAELIDCRLMKRKDEKEAYCDFEEGCYAWILKDIRQITPFPVKGKLGLFEISEAGERFTQEVL